MATAKIIVATHKKYDMPEDPLYLPLHVGAQNARDASGMALELGYQKDNEGENISEKNPQYSELTGLYWAWKHLDADYIGLAHYRRHFGSGRDAASPMQKVLKAADLAPMLGRYDVFVPKKRNYVIETLHSHYMHTHDVSHLDAARTVIWKRDPMYLEAYDYVLRMRSGYMFNMMILPRDLLDRYCTWLFGILSDLEKELDTEHLSAFQARMFGRISEILWNAWLMHEVDAGAIRRDRIRELPVVYMEPVDWKKKGTAFLKAKFLKQKYEESF